MTEAHPGRSSSSIPERSADSLVRLFSGIGSDSGGQGCPRSCLRRFLNPPRNPYHQRILCLPPDVLSWLIEPGLQAK